MKITGLILFFGSIIAMLVWLYSLFKQLTDHETLFRTQILKHRIEINVLPGIIIFIMIAVSAGMVWG